MDVREKLVELIENANYLCDNRDCDEDAEGCAYHCYANCWAQFIADHLIANGVTVQEWISVKDRLPDEDERVIVWIGNNRYNDVRKDTDRVHNGRWVRWGGCVTHWSPWNMPQPPKGE